METVQGFTQSTDNGSIHAAATNSYSGCSIWDTLVSILQHFWTEAKFLFAVNISSQSF